MVEIIELYGIQIKIDNDLPQVFRLIKSRRVQFAGHCLCASKEIASSIFPTEAKINC